MKREMEAVTVRTNEEWIVIEQQHYGDDPAGVVISPEQVPVLIKWLQEAAKEFEQPQE